MHQMNQTKPNIKIFYDILTAGTVRECAQLVIINRVVFPLEFPIWVRRLGEKFSFIRVYITQNTNYTTQPAERCRPHRLYLNIFNEGRCRRLAAGGATASYNRLLAGAKLPIGIQIGLLFTRREPNIYACLSSALPIVHATSGTVWLVHITWPLYGCRVKTQK